MVTRTTLSIKVLSSYPFHGTLVKHLIHPCMPWLPWVGNSGIPYTTQFPVRVSLVIILQGKAWSHHPHLDLILTYTRPFDFKIMSRHKSTHSIQLLKVSSHPKQSPDEATRKATQTAWRGGNAHSWIGFQVEPRALDLREYDCAAQLRSSHNQRTMHNASMVLLKPYVIRVLCAA